MNPDPLPPRVGCEDPSLTAAFDQLLAEVPVTPPKTYGYELWKHMADEHGLTLLESELSEILRIAGRILNPEAK